MSTKVFPCDFHPSSSSNPPPCTAHSRIGVLATMAAKVFGAVSRRFDRLNSPNSPSSSNTSSSSSSTDEPHHGHSTRQPVSTIIQMPASTYQQSSTRRLAFGVSSFDADSSKHLNDFYNNSTLTTVSKMFCAVILLIAFVLIMSRSFNHDSMASGNSTSSDIFFF